MNDQKLNRIKINFNSGWKFTLNDVQGSEHTAFNDELWETVNLPHTPKVETVDVWQHFQGICWYRKSFNIDRSYDGKKIFIEFEAAMHTADVWVNGKHKLTHVGGYLPFTIDITEDVVFYENNIISVKLNNRDNGDIPPGKPLAKLDFCYFGGLYRNAYMHVTEKLHITDAVYADMIAGGGVFVKYTNVSKDSATINVSTHVINENSSDKNVKVVTTIVEDKGTVVCTIDSPEDSIDAGGEHTFEQSVMVKNPKLWHPDSPYLYMVITQVMDGDTLVDEVKTSAGIRSIACRKPEGFILNGEPLKIRGTNRHQQYPYIGIAASDNAQYRDAKKLKDAGFNFIRLAHYPQSPSFLDACDELGLMVVEPVPGWQWCQEGVFQDIVLKNIKDMIRRDRNHPCVVLWEVSLNETGTYWKGADDEFFHKCHETAHEEYPGDQLLTSGDTLGRKNAKYVGFDVPHTEWDEENKSRPLNSLPDKMGMDREYGDFEFGGHYSTTRVFRGDGERALLQQAWNYQWSHNKNLGNPWSTGDSIWVGIDYNRGCASDRPICNCGILDTFRIPKFAYYFYQSQRNINIIGTDNGTGPMVYIANYWIPSEKVRNVVVYSNCEEVKLYINGRFVAARKPDNGPDADFKEQNVDSTVDYWLENKDMPGVEKQEIDALALHTIRTLFDGGNCKRLCHAPFTFTDIPYEDGEIRAVGFIGGKEAAVYSRRTPDKPCRLSLRYDISGKDLKADGGDFVFVYAEVMDKNGTIVPDAAHEIKFSASGKGELVGANPVKAEAGVATILLKSQTDTGRISVTAQNDELGETMIEIYSMM